jgi:NADPH-dependent curcumin reductase CurA
MPSSFRQLNDPFYGLGVAEVVASGYEKYPVGTLVSGNTGYEKFTRLSGLNDPNTQSDIRVLPAHARDESKGVPLSNYISALGMPGLTAYAGLKVLGIESKKTIFVGSAAGGVGQLVGQLAKVQGLRVIGSGLSRILLRRMMGSKMEEVVEFCHNSLQLTICSFFFLSNHSRLG